MFFLKGQRDRHDLQHFLRCIADLTNPDGNVEAVGLRRDHRLLRTFPIFLVPLDHDNLNWKESALGLSHDISERGMGAIINRRFAHQHVVVGLWPTNELVTAATSRPGFIRGEIRGQGEMGGGFYRLGILFKGLLNESHPDYETLFQRAKSLLPPEQLRLWKMAHQ